MGGVTQRRSTSSTGQLFRCQYAQFLVFFTWIVTAVTALPIDGESGNTSQMNKYRLPDNVVPTHYDIKLIPYIEGDASNFNGETSTVIQVRRPTSSLHLHALQLTIDEAATTLIGSNGNSYVPTAYNNDNVTQILIIEFDTDLPPGEYILHLKFVGILTDGGFGFYRRSYNEEETRRLVATRFRPTSARRAFPSWDEPALKATFNISIKHNRNYTALSNMPIREQTDDDNDLVWTHFEKTPIMSTYLVAFIVVSDLIRISNEDETINVWCESFRAPNVKYMQEIAVTSKQLLTEYTNSTVKIPKIDQVLMPLYLDTNVENWGLIFYNEQFMYEENKNPVIEKLFKEQEVAYEVARQWLGDTVSPSWWSHIWLNEGLAVILSEFVMNRAYPNLRKQELFVIDTHQKALHDDVAKNTKPITFYKDVNTTEEIAELLKSNRDKVPSLLRMLHHILSADVFQKGIIKYLNAHQFSSATSDDLWSAFQEALDESDVPHDDYNVKEVMDTWINQRHYPVVHVTRNYENGDVILTQKPVRPRNDTDHADDEKWWIPITFATRSNPDFSNTLPTHWLKPQDEHLIIKGIDLDDWIIVNVQETGYYRVQYDFPSWYKIADYLNSNDYEKIHVLNRAQILDDFYHLMTHPSDLVKFEELANYLYREKNYIAWAPIFEFVKNKKDDFNNFANTRSLKVHLVKLLNYLVKHVGSDEYPTDEFSKVARFVTLIEAVVFGNIEGLKIGQKKLEEIQTDFEKLSPEDSYVYIGMASPDIIFCKEYECYDELDSTVLQKSWSEKPDIFINFLNTSVSDDTVSDNEYNTIYDTIVQKHADNDSLLDYLLANTDKTISRGCTTQEIFEKIIKSVHSVERLEKISNFVKDNFDNETFERAKTAIDKREAEL